MYILAIVHSEKWVFGEMYILASVHSGKCTFEEKSIRPTVHSGKSPFWKMYIRYNVHSAKWFLGKCPFWKVFFGEMYKVLEILLGNARNLAEKLRRPFLFSSIGDSLKKFLKTFFFRTLVPVSLVVGLGLEHPCLWPREDLSSEGLSLALASDFFVSLALSLVSSTPPLIIRQ